MLPIYQQVLEALDRINDKCIHDVTTDISRKLASLQMGSHLNLYRDLKESSVVIYVFEKTKALKSTGYFGLWGHKGSVFIQEMTKVLAGTVRGLGLMTAEVLEKKLLKSKNEAKKEALQAFIIILNDENSTDEQILDVARRSPLLTEFIEKASQLQGAKPLQSSKSSAL